MSTNFYAHMNTCESCKRPEETLHLGKSSMGWRFAIEVQKKHYRDYESFKAFIRRSNIVIRDEYGALIEPQVLIDLIESKKKGQSHIPLMEHPRDCAGDGPVDLCFYEFS